jgi:uncharacterized membrane protein YdfJ with MMPL/SSD domain
MMQTWGRFVAQRAWAVLIGGLVLAAGAAVFGLGVFGSLSNGGFDDPASESARSLAAEHSTFTSHDPDIVVIYSSASMKVSDPAFKESVLNVIKGLPKGSAERVTTWYEAPSPTLVSKDEHATRVIISLKGTSQSQKSSLYDQVRPQLNAKGLTTNVGGQWAVFGDVNHTVSHDIARAEGLSMPIVFILCLVIFGSFVSALMPALVGTIAIFGAFAFVRAITMATDVSIFAINVITLLGMGLAIDYALFVVSRFREELAKAPGTDREHVNAAITATMATAGRTVLFSGLIVAASLASLVIFPQNFLRSVGYGGVAAVLVAMVAALTLLPALRAGSPPSWAPASSVGRTPPPTSWSRGGPRASSAPASDGSARSAGCSRHGRSTRLRAAPGGRAWSRSAGSGTVKPKGRSKSSRTCALSIPAPGSANLSAAHRRVPLTSLTPSAHTCRGWASSLSL